MMPSISIKNNLAKTTNTTSLFSSDAIRILSTTFAREQQVQNSCLSSYVISLNLIYDPGGSKSRKQPVQMSRDPIKNHKYFTCFVCKWCHQFYQQRFSKNHMYKIFFVFYASHRIKTIMHKILWTTIFQERSHENNLYNICHCCCFCMMPANS